jgi:hypothetical protein
MYHRQVLPKVMIDIGAAKLVLTNAQVIEIASGDVGWEQMSLNFEEVKKTYVEYDEKGGKTANVEMNWSVEKGSK